MLRKSFQYLSPSLKHVKNILHVRYSSVPASSSIASRPNWIKKSKDAETKEYFEKNDPDVFGTLTKAPVVLSEPEKIDEGDAKEEKFLSEPPKRSKRLSTKGYADIIKDYIRKRQIKEAIDVLEVRMLKEDRVKPENYIYNLLLGGCGRLGYTKKAFQLFNDMKKRGLKTTGGTYTALFNACSNSPWIEDGLSRAKHLRVLMLEQRIVANDTTYNAMIKAFGRCGDLQTAFTLVDEMIENKVIVQEDTINFLLQSCITDKTAGFRHALLVWRKFYQRNIKPNIYSFNLILRCVRDCEMGDVETINNLLASPEFQCLEAKPNLQIESKNFQESDNLTLNSTNFDRNHLLETSSDKRDSAGTNLDKDLFQTSFNKQESKFNQTTLSEKPFVETTLEESSLRQTDSEQKNSVKSKTLSTDLEEKFNWPNLIAPVPYLGNIIQLERVTKPEHRLMLLGGLTGFLKNMENENVLPNIKTFTLLLDCIPPTQVAEQALLNYMKKNGIQYDVDFLNMLIKRRCLRCDYDSAKEVLILFKRPKLQPDLVTYGVLALTCKTNDEAQLLLQEMNESGYRINIEILGAMLRQGTTDYNFDYINSILRIVSKEKIKPNKIFMKHLDDFAEKCQQRMKQKKDKKFKGLYKSFKEKEQKWKEKIEIDEIDDVHPWSQFRISTETNVKNYKDKSSRFQPKIISRYKQKTGPLKTE